MNQRNAELQAITDTINLYAEGLHSGNIETLKLYGFVSANDPPSKTGEPHQCFITSIRHDGNAASVEMIEESAYGSDYTNYFQLLKIDGTWVIVSKTYNTISKS